MDWKEGDRVVSTLGHHVHRRKVGVVQRPWGRSDGRVTVWEVEWPGGARTPEYPGDLSRPVWVQHQVPPIVRWAMVMALVALAAWMAARSAWLCATAHLALCVGWERLTRPRERQEGG